MRSSTTRVCTCTSPSTMRACASIASTPERKRKSPARTAFENGTGSGVG